QTFDLAAGLRTDRLQHLTPLSNHDRALTLLFDEDGSSYPNQPTCLGFALRFVEVVHHHRRSVGNFLAAKAKQLLAHVLSRPYPLGLIGEHFRVVKRLS